VTLELKGESPKKFQLLTDANGDRYKAGLPPGTRVAHKTGSITAVLHDAAIVYPQGKTPYVLVVLTRNIPDERAARVLIADLSRLVYQHVGQPAS
jgi:beta-lactamase class A